MNIVAYGGGTNSPAMIIGMYRDGISIDLILFADTGAERPHTYAYLGIFNAWLSEHDLPIITPVYNVDKNGDRFTLEDECLKSHTLPSLAYGFKKCSLKHKKAPQDKYCNNSPQCQAVWSSGEKINKYIGYDAGEWQRRQNAIVYDQLDKKYNYVYPLIDDWDWDREKCIEVIESEGLPLPGKSSCFFCPAMKLDEIRDLYGNHRDLLERAIAIEDNACDYLTSIKGLGRDWAWKEFVEADKAGMVFCEIFKSSNMPCSCYDG